jgi:hypothetical protein
MFQSRTTEMFQRASSGRRTHRSPVWIEKCPNHRGKTLHPHRKPASLNRVLSCAITEFGYLIVDLSAGSFVVMDEAHACGRRFLGTDLQ